MRRAIRLAEMPCVIFPVAACLSPTAYVDPALPAAGKEDITAVQTRAPIQLLFEFQTKGAANAAATKSLQPAALGVMQRSDLFSEVSQGPTGNERRLFITINNVAVDQSGGRRPL
jgi:hypothetical protein